MKPKPLAIPAIKPHLGTFASGTDADVAHHLFIAGEFLNQLARLGDEYGKLRSDAAHGVMSATVRYAVLVARGMGMTRGELVTLVKANWGD
jgi:hypothetical protein